eukprot:4770843-Lingulodinium_polyedra.AAC.1
MAEGQCLACRSFPERPSPVDGVLANVARPVLSVGDKPCVRGLCKFSILVSPEVDCTTSKGDVQKIRTTCM